MKPGFIVIGKANCLVRPKLKSTEHSNDEESKPFGILPQKHCPPSSVKMRHKKIVHMIRIWFVCTRLSVTLPRRYTFILYLLCAEDAIMKTP